MLQVAKPDVVVASYEALVSDAASLQTLHWDLIAVDERTRLHSALARTYQALSAFESRSRAIIAHPCLLHSVCHQLMHAYSGFLQSEASCTDYPAACCSFKIYIIQSTG